MNTPQLRPGLRVLCVHVNDARFASQLVGQVGTIVAPISGLMAFLTQNDWEVDFPDTLGMVCPDCHHAHGPVWPMASNELRPLEDPDPPLEAPRDHSVDLSETSDIEAHA